MTRALQQGSVERFWVWTSHLCKIVSLQRLLHGARLVALLDLQLLSIHLHVLHMTTP